MPSSSHHQDGSRRRTHGTTTTISSGNQYLAPPPMLHKDEAGLFDSRTPEERKRDRDAKRQAQVDNSDLPPPLRRSYALQDPNKKSGGKLPRRAPPSPRPSDVFSGVVNGVKGVVQDGIKYAKQADKATDGAVSDLVRNVSLLALEHQAMKRGVVLPPKK